MLYLNPDVKYQKTQEHFTHAKIWINDSIVAMQNVQDNVAIRWTKIITRVIHAILNSIFGICHILYVKVCESYSNLKALILGYSDSEFLSLFVHSLWGEEGWNGSTGTLDHDSFKMFNVTEIGKNWKNEINRPITVGHKSIPTRCQEALVKRFL